MKKSRIIIISIVSILIVAAIGASYAYFTANSSGAESVSTIKVTGGTMSVLYENNSSNITLENIYPKADSWATKNFTITGTNTTDLTMNYYVYLVIDSSTFFGQALTYSLNGTNDSSNGTLLQNVSDEFIFQSKRNILLGQGTFEKGSDLTHKYALSFKYPKAEDEQNVNQGKSLSAHIEIFGEEQKMLTDSILEQNGGTNTITSKTNPDFTATAPKTIYKENGFSGYKEKYVSTDRMSDTNLLCASNYTFNQYTGKFTLTGTYNCVPKNAKNAYTPNPTSYSGSYTEIDKIYKMTTIGYSYWGYTVSDTPSSNGKDCSECGMYSQPDNYGTSYYYRGQVDNNWVKFANKYWRIVRINGDGTIRLIYSGTTAPTSGQSSLLTGSETQILAAQYATLSNDNMYSGFFYNNDEIHGLTTPSAVYGVTDSDSNSLRYWYANNINNNQNYSSKVADNIFCNDRSSFTNPSGTEGGGTGTTTTYYGSYIRNITNKNPSLNCETKEDRFSGSNSSLGNGVLNYPVGLITLDELAFAGASYGMNNPDFFLNTLQNYWTMSPATYNGASQLFTNSSVSSLTTTSSASSAGIRPVINIMANAFVTGNGTWNNPYIIK